MKKFHSMVKPHWHFDLVTLKSNIFVFDDRVYSNESLDKSNIPVEIYSEKTKTWTHKYVEMKERYDYCLISFMSKLYLIGGHSKCSDRHISSC